MLGVDRKFLARVELLGLVLWLYKRYVDDMTVSGPPLRHGWLYNVEKKSMVYDPTTPEIPGDQRLMEALRAIADEVDPNIKFTYDCPSLNSNGKVPVLDLQLWTEGGRTKNLHVL